MLWNRIKSNDIQIERSQIKWYSNRTIFMSNKLTHLCQLHVLNVFGMEAQRQSMMCLTMLWSSINTYYNLNVTLQLCISPNYCTSTHPLDPRQTRATNFATAATPIHVRRNEPRASEESEPTDCSSALVASAAFSMVRPYHTHNYRMQPWADETLNDTDSVFAWVCQITHGLYCVLCCLVCFVLLRAYTPFSYDSLSLPSWCECLALSCYAL
jgi:hypothetical protein